MTVVVWINCYKKLEVFMKIIYQSSTGTITTVPVPKKKTTDINNSAYVVKCIHFEFGI